MQYIRDRWNHWQYGNTGTVTAWTYIPGFMWCKALVRDDGKILSTIDCWSGERLPYPKENAIVVYKDDGPYLLRQNKLFELNQQTNQHVLDLLKTKASSPNVTVNLK